MFTLFELCKRLQELGFGPAPYINLVRVLSQPEGGVVSYDCRRVYVRRVGRYNYMCRLQP